MASMCFVKVYYVKSFLMVFKRKIIWLKTLRSTYQKPYTVRYSLNLLKQNLLDILGMQTYIAYSNSINLPSIFT